MANLRKNGWSEIPLDIMFEIVIANGKQLSLADIGRMTAVCKSWRSSLRENDWFGLRGNVEIGKTSFPWLMLVKSKGGSYGMRKIFNPASGEVSEIYLPEARGTRCCGSGYGWIVTMGKDMEIKLLNPLTREQLKLPSQLTFTQFFSGTSNREVHESYTKRRLRSMFINKAILTCNPISTECLVVALLGVPGDFELVFAKPGDLTWTHLSINLALTTWRLVADILFFQGKLLCITFHGDLIELDLNDKCSTYQLKVISSVLPGHQSRMDEVKLDVDTDFSFYLVPIAGELVVVSRQRDMKTSNDYTTQKIVAFKFSKNLEWSQIDDIGDSCLFLGTNESICVSPTPRGLRPNSMYFTDNLYFFPPLHHTIAGRDMVVYSMESGEFTPFYVGENILSEYSPPLWVTLNSTTRESNKV